jgi:hypothetical protein
MPIHAIVNNIIYHKVPKTYSTLIFQLDVVANIATATYTRTFLLYSFFTFVLLDSRNDRASVLVCSYIRLNFSVLNPLTFKTVK